MACVCIDQQVLQAPLHGTLDGQKVTQLKSPPLKPQGRCWPSMSLPPPSLPSYLSSSTPPPTHTQTYLETFSMSLPCRMSSSLTVSLRLMVTPGSIFTSRTRFSPRKFLISTRVPCSNATGQQQ